MEATIRRLDRTKFFFKAEEKELGTNYRLRNEGRTRKYPSINKFGRIGPFRIGSGRIGAVTSGLQHLWMSINYVMKNNGERIGLWHV